MTHPTNPDLRDELVLILTGKPGEASAALVRKAEETARRLVDNNAAQGDTGKAQIRAIFDELRQIEAVWLSNEQRALHRVHLLKPKMAYRASKARGLAPLVEVLSPAVDIVVQETDPAKAFARLVELGEAIIAYYTAQSSQQGGRR
jgi:CRISPR type III-A-associated protein Csm2